MEKPNDTKKPEGLPMNFPIRSTVRKFKRNASGICEMSESQSLPAVKKGAAKENECFKPSQDKIEKALPPKKGKGDCVKKTEEALPPKKGEGDCVKKTEEALPPKKGEGDCVKKTEEDLPPKKGEGDCVKKTDEVAFKPNPDRNDNRREQGPRSGFQQGYHRPYPSRGRGVQRTQWDRKEFSDNQNQRSGGPRGQWNNRPNDSSNNMRPYYGQRQHGTNYSRHTPGDQKQNYEQQAMNENRSTYNQRPNFGNNQRGARTDRGKDHHPQSNASSGPEEKGNRVQTLSKIYQGIGNNQQHHPPTSGQMNASEDNRSQYKRMYDNPGQNYGSQRGSWNHQGERGHPPRQGPGFNRHDQIENRRFYSDDRRGGGRGERNMHQWNNRMQENRKDQASRPAWFYKRGEDSKFNEKELEYMANWLDRPRNRDAKQTVNDNSNKTPEAQAGGGDDDDWETPKNSGKDVTRDDSSPALPPTSSAFPVVATDGKDGKEDSTVEAATDEGAIYSANTTDVGMEVVEPQTVDELPVSVDNPETISGPGFLDVEENRGIDSINVTIQDQENPISILETDVQLASVSISTLDDVPAAVCADDHVTISSSALPPTSSEFPVVVTDGKDGEDDSTVEATAEEVVVSSADIPSVGMEVLVAADKASACQTVDELPVSVDNPETISGPGFLDVEENRGIESINVIIPDQENPISTLDDVPAAVCADDHVTISSPAMALALPPTSSAFPVVVVDGSKDEEEVITVEATTEQIVVSSADTMKETDVLLSPVSNSTLDDVPPAAGTDDHVTISSSALPPTFSAFPVVVTDSKDGKGVGTVEATAEEVVVSSADTTDVGMEVLVAADKASACQTVDELPVSVDNHETISGPGFLDVEENRRIELINVIIPDQENPTSILETDVQLASVSISTLDDFPPAAGADDHVTISSPAMALPPTFSAFPVVVVDSKDGEEVGTVEATAEVVVPSADTTDVGMEVVEATEKATACQTVDEVPISVLDPGNISGPGFLDLEEIYRVMYEMNSSN